MIPRPPGRRRPAAALLAAAVVVAAAGCGKKGPPLPPLVRTPAPPAGFSAARVGDLVRIRFTVPAANTDGTRPANVERVDVYAFTGDVPLTDPQIVRYASRIASVAVQGPRDPDDVIEPGDPAEDLEPLTGAGLEQGAPVSLEEPITPASYLLVDRPPEDGPSPPDLEGPRPLVVSAPQPLMRTYVAVAVTTSGRPASFSESVPVPLSPALPPPPAPSVRYDETAVTLEWPVPEPPPAEDGVVPSRWFGTPLRSLRYHVYEDDAAGGATRLTGAPIAEGEYEDTRLTWGARRCYDVRAVETVNGVAVESAASAPACVTLTDTFPPPPPAGLTAVGTEGAVNLIWEASPAPDLAGYLVLRGESADQLAPVTPAPIPDTNFRDVLPAGERRAYAVQAVDRAGNASAASATVEEAAR